MDEVHPVRRVASGLHDIRFDGISDLLLRGHGCSVLDVGCNRGHVLYDFAMQGARVVHGCDIHGPSMIAARHWFSELPHVQSKFEVVNLEGGAEAMRESFGDEQYDIVLLLGTTHKLKRTMQPVALSQLVTHLGQRALTYFAWGGYAVDLPVIDHDMKRADLTRIHTSELAKAGQPMAIWRRGA